MARVSLSAAGQDPHCDAQCMARQAQSHWLTVSAEGDAYLSSTAMRDDVTAKATDRRTVAPVLKIDGRPWTRSSALSVVRRGSDIYILLGSGSCGRTEEKYVAIAGTS